MASGILGTAVSGLMAFQRSLDTTSHNIANVNTEGYSRQQVELATRPEQFTGAGFLGQGVGISNISRSYDQFISNQLRFSTSAFGDVDHYHQLATQVDAMMADPSTGMAPAIKNFFNSVNDVSDDPSSIPARQAMLSEAENLTQRFSSMNARFEQLRSQVNNDVGVMVDNINSYANSIAGLNVKIAADISRSTGLQEPNDLLDQRDVLLNKLAELVDISVLPQQNGMVSVFIGQGQSLVLDANASELSAVPSALDPSRLGISINATGGTQDITSYISGGALAGTLRFRDEILDPSQQKLGQVAAGLAMEFNALHETGYDLDGKPGAALFGFSGAEVPVAANPANTGNAVVTARFQDPNGVPDAAKNLDFSDFKLAYDGANYTLTRVRDNQVINLTAVETAVGSNVYNLTFGTSSDPSITALPGFEITVDLNGGAINAGDQFLTRPTYGAAQKIGVNTDDPRKIAAATNIEVDPATGSPVLDGSGNPVIINGPMPGDNRNALLLAGLENKLGLLGGNATFQDAYGQIVSGVGTLTRSAELSASAQEALLNQAKESRENLAGVNLDEEAANLIKFQQSYQAAAQLISVTNSLFDTLMGAVR